MMITMRDTAIHLLDRQQIRAALPTTTAALLRTIHVFPQLDSTNRWCLEEGQCGDVCLAEQQTAGRGRRGRQWESPAGSNIYLSLRWCFDSVPEQLPMLGLVVGIAVAEALQDVGIQGHRVKWPNDITHQGKKLGGILLEAVGTLQTVVIGIGLNVNMQTHAGTIDQPWTSLQAIHAQTFDRNRIVAAVLQRLLPRLRTFSTLDMAQFQHDWLGCDMLFGHPVRVLSGNATMEGLARGIDQQGQLRVEFSDGSVTAFSSADVSVRM